MKKILLLLFVLFVADYCFAQDPYLQKKLFYTCKVWGFVKYYHSEVSTCQVNWDSVLTGILPLVKNATNDLEFNDALDTMLMAAGPTALASALLPDTIPAELKGNRDFSWINDPIFRGDTRTILDTIKNNFRPHPGCYVELDTSYIYTGNNGGFLFFPKDTPMVNKDTWVSYPGEGERLLMLFKYWNVINYFNPNNYILDKPIDSVLNSAIYNIDTVSTPQGLFTEIQRITTGLNDAHTYDFTYSYNSAVTWLPKIMLRYIQGKYVVVKSGVGSIKPGYAIISINGKTTTDLEDSLAHYCSAGNSAVFRSYLCQNVLLAGASGTSVRIDYEDTSGVLHTTTAYRTQIFYDPWLAQVYYPADSLSSIKWTTLSCGTGYVNTANLSFEGADSAYEALRNLPAIIVDLRNSTSTDFGADKLARDMMNVSCDYAKFTIPDVTYPGVFYWQNSSVVMSDNPYNGLVILLFNQYTQSHSETYCMLFDAMTNVYKIGSQTAGADGNVTFFQLTKDINTGFSSLGTYYPNGDSVQRVGIVPDLTSEPTISGIANNRDELLEEAIRKGCALSTTTVGGRKRSIAIYPNPATDILTIQGKALPDKVVDIVIRDCFGKVIAREQRIVENGDLTVKTDVSKFGTGVYFISISSELETNTCKFIKQ